MSEVNEQVVSAAKRIRWKPARGQIQRRDLHNGQGAGYLLFIPASDPVDAPCFVSIPGLAQNYREHAQIFAPPCEQQGAVMLVPQFAENRPDDYQRLGRLGLGQRADLLLNRCLEEVALMTGADTSRIYLFGYSGGAQFAHRYLLAHPHRVANAVLAGAGWYTFPDNRLKYPYGIRSSHKLPGVLFNPEEFLRIPVTVLIGEHDVGSTSLRRNPELDEQQGVTRVERAHKWVAAMQAAAVTHGFQSRVSCIEVPGTDHSFRQFTRRGALAERVFGALFGTSADSPQGARAGAAPDAVATLETEAP